MRTLLILVGPQGSGNHMFSKLFGLHPEVESWTALQRTFWLPHDTEPFNEFWADPDAWRPLTTSLDYAVTSISIPFVHRGHTQVPRFDDFVSQAIKHGWQVKVAIIGRDKNILECQQRRLRGGMTFGEFEKALPTLMQYNPVFISHELAVLYGSEYLKSLSLLLDFPIDAYNPQVDTILYPNANQKYVKYLEESSLDILVKNGAADWAEPGSEWDQNV